MWKLLVATFVALLMAGCGTATLGPDSPESHQTSAETSDAKTAQVEEIDLDDNETRKKIIAEAIPVGLIDSGVEKLERRGKEGEELLYAPDQQAPYSGWVKGVYDIGRISGLYQYKDGKRDGLWTGWYSNGQKEYEATYKDDKRGGLSTMWYRNGQKSSERTYKDGKLWTAVGWKFNGEECPDTNVVNGNGVRVEYWDDGTEKRRDTFKDGKRDKD
jgi:antitoxin component YwqK of YwqJK toxin-antitoxin module